MLTVSGKTRCCGIIGDPIEHTISPAMHNAAFNQLGLDYVYVPFQVKKEDLDRAIKGIRALNIRGLNVTLPHKVAVIQYLDELDGLVKKIGAVNTIVNDEGILKGYNTDATGFLQTLRERGIEPAGKEVVILGAGGAAQAISFILAEKGANLTIINRTLHKATEYASVISEVFRKKVNALKLNRESLIKVLGKTDILVNATSTGMSPNIDETPVTADLIKPTFIVFDIVYNPNKTRLLREAEVAGAETISGLEMLLWQGALAFELWTGVKAPVELMRAEIIKGLKSHEK
jgi:shikimate dehydrogenase